MPNPAIKDQLQRLLKELEKDESGSSPSLSELFSSYLEVEAKYLKSSQRTIDAWKAIADLEGGDGVKLKDRPALSVTADVAEEVRDKLKTMVTRFGTAPKPATRNRYFIVLRRLLNWAVEHKKIPYNPLRIAKEPEDNVRQTVIRTEEDFQRLIDCCDPWNRALCLVYFDSGCRRMEVIDLQRHQVTRKPNGGGWATIYKAKGNKPRTVVLTKRAMEALDGLPNRGSYYFARPDGRKPYHRRYLYHRFEKAVIRSGLQPAPGESITWHTLRSSFCYVRRVVDHWAESTIMRQTGHSTDIAFRRYGWGDTRELDEAFDGVELRRESERKGPHRASDLSDEDCAKKKSGTG